MRVDVFFQEMGYSKQRDFYTAANFSTTDEPRIIMNVRIERYLTPLIEKRTIFRKTHWSTVRIEVAKSRGIHV